MRLIDRARDFFWPLTVGVLILYGFFVVMGGFSPVEVAGLTAIVVIMGLLFALHEVRLTRRLRHHGAEETMHALHRDRERRGF